jgi:nucleoside-diphosphate-sugar epimerase
VTVLVTGAAGGVARMLRGGLAPAFDLRLTDRVPGPDIVAGDLRDAAFAREVCEGVDALVHLAANADPDAEWAALRGPNADGLVSVLDAAVAAGVTRVVIASSLHAMGGHVDAGVAEVGEDAPPYPCCAYGALKVFAESLGLVYADQYDLRVVCLRLGGVLDEPPARSWLPGWLSGPDLVRLVTAALTADVRYGVYHGISANSTPQWRFDRARAELGYAPRDDAARYAERLPDDLSGAAGARLLHLT